MICAFDYFLNATKTVLPTLPLFQLPNLVGNTEMEEETRRFSYTTYHRASTYRKVIPTIGEFKRYFPKHHDFDREPIIRIVIKFNIF